MITAKAMGATDAVDVKLIVAGICRLVRVAAREDWDTIILGISDLESMNTSCVLNEKIAFEWNKNKFGV